MKNVWIITKTRPGAWGAPDEEVVVAVAGNYYAAKEVVEGLAPEATTTLHDDGTEVVAFSREGDDCEVTARRWKVST